MPTSICQICRAPLNVDGDALSTDCGGDCWGCVGLAEAEAGDAESARRVADEIERGLRHADGRRAVHATEK